MPDVMSGKVRADVCISKYVAHRSILAQAAVMRSCPSAECAHGAGRPALRSAARAAPVGESDAAVTATAPTAVAGGGGRRRSGSGSGVR